MADVKLSLLVLKTRRPDDLRRFYGAIGLEFVEEQHGKGPLHFSGQAGDVLVEIYPLPSDHNAADATTRFGFSVEHLNVTIGAIEATGAVVVSPPHETEWGLRAVVRDPDGRSVELYQH